MDSTKSYKIAPNLYLVRQTLGSEPKKVAKPVKTPTNHLVVIDCSGSMYYDLPRIREQLKKKLPKLLAQEDTISVIWFSGRRQFGVLLEAEPVATLTDLQDVNAAIDRWLRPIGLTGFKEPLEEAAKLVDRVSKKRPGSAFSLFFMSDGYDNQWGRAEILSTMESLSGKLGSITIVEYGHYADRQLLTAMAQKAGGTLIFAEDFNKYAPVFEGKLTQTVSTAPRVEVKVEGDPIEGFVFTATTDKDLISYEVTGGKISAPKDLQWIAYLSSSSVGKDDGNLVDVSKIAAKNPKTSDPACVATAYAATTLFALRMKSNIVLPLLGALGDVRFIEQFSGCFGKQKYNEFMAATQTAAYGEGRFENGWDPNKVPSEDAFTVFDFLRILASDDDNRVLLDSKDFEYKRIGRPQLDPDVKRLEDLKEQLASENDKAKCKELKKEISALEKQLDRLPPLSFDFEDEPNGYPVSNLTFNETRPNISILIRKEGVVDISKRVPAEMAKKLPMKFPTYIHRNYTIVKDGIVNVTRLPVRMTAGTVRQMREAGMPMEAILNIDGETVEQARTRIKKAGTGRPVSFVVDLLKIPVINRKMVNSVSAAVVARKTYEMLQAKADQKVFNSILKEKFPKKSEGFKVVYGDVAAAWLQEEGITDYNGFGPKTVQADASDVYMGKELNVKLKGLSSLPTLAKAQEGITKAAEKLKKSKDKTASVVDLLTPSVALMATAIAEVDAFLASDAYKSAANQDDMFATWLKGKLDASRTEARRLMFELAQIKFSVVVGQVWFSEFASLDENTIEIDVAGKKVSCTIEMKEIEVKI